MHIWLPRRAKQNFRIISAKGTVETVDKDRPVELVIDNDNEGVKFTFNGEK